MSEMPAPRNRSFRPALPQTVLSTAARQLWNIYQNAVTQAPPGAVRTPQGGEDPRAAALEFFEFVMEFEIWPPQSGRAPAGLDTRQELQAPPDVLYRRAPQQPGAGIGMIDRDESYVLLQVEERGAHTAGLQRTISRLGQEIELGRSSGPVAGPSAPGARAARESWLSCQVEGCEMFGVPMLPSRFRVHNEADHLGVRHPCLRAECPRGNPTYRHRKDLLRHHRVTHGDELPNRTAATDSQSARLQTGSVVSGQAMEPAPHHNPPGFSRVTNQAQYGYQIGLHPPAQYESWDTVYSNGPSAAASDSVWDQDGSVHSYWRGRPA